VTNTRATDPERQAVWTLPKLAERVGQWADEEYDLLPHPAHGMTPRQAYDLSIECDGARLHKLIAYDETFRMATFPTTRKGTALVQPGAGVRMNYLDYWCEAMRDPTIENTQVKVRYDPFDVSVGFAYIDGKWRKCITPYNELAGCSERELQLLTAELRKRNRLLSGKEHIELTQKQLAVFRRENSEIETLLRQQRHDRETRAALVVLEGGKSAKVAPEPLHAVSEKRRLARDTLSVSSSQTAEKKHGKLLVFRRIPR
jgi:putative transposase